MSGERCNHSDKRPDFPRLACDPGSPYHDDSGACRDCDIINLDAYNGWEWDKDMRRGYCPQPDCGVFLGDVPESDWPDWFKARDAEPTEPHDAAPVYGPLDPKTGVHSLIRKKEPK